MSNNVDKIIELKKMLDEGNITQQEFEKMKKELFEEKANSFLFFNNKLKIKFLSDII